VTNNVFTVDLEDWYQGLEIDMDRWDGFAPRMERGMSVLLDLLDEAGARATFFVLGRQAELSREVVREVARRGHEVASHGYSHRFVYRQSPQEFRSELRRSKLLLEEIVGQPVVGYRAPFFSITRDSRWALDILVEEGFRYDSSLFPVLNYRYGLPSADRRPRLIRTPAGAEIFEVPMSTLRVPSAGFPGGFNLPVSGGGYFRLYPYWLTRALASRLRGEGSGLVFYVHPWEYDPDHPRVRMPRLVPWFTHYFNLRSMAGKTRRLLRDFAFVPIREAYGPQFLEPGAR
jgi:polysaccharide deacetylase family protein (PEP-CTERM system associated)